MLIIISKFQSICCTKNIFFRAHKNKIPPKTAKREPKLNPMAPNIMPSVARNIPDDDNDILMGNLKANLPPNMLSTYN